jgi:hypothetical protein
MEWRIDGVPVTLAAVGDGSMSLYFGNGGGFIGCGEHPPVREVGLKLLAYSGMFLRAFRPTSEFPIVEDGDLQFIARSFDGDFICQAPYETVMKTDHFLTRLFAGANELIHQISLHSESGRPVGPLKGNVKED